MLHGNAVNRRQRARCCHSRGGNRRAQTGPHRPRPRGDRGTQSDKPADIQQEGEEESDVITDPCGIGGERFKVPCRGISRQRPRMQSVADGSQDGADKEENGAHLEERPLRYRAPPPGFGKRFISLRMTPCVRGAHPIVRSDDPEGHTAREPKSLPR